MTRRAAIGIMALATWMLPLPAAAQNVAGSLAELLSAGTLQDGDGIYVTDAAGRRIKGSVGDLSRSALVVRDGGDTWTMSDADIREIDRQDSLQNGIWIGAGLAFAGSIGACRLEMNADEFCYRTAYLMLPAMAASALVGALIDASRHRTLYRARGAARLTVSPLASGGLGGVRASLSW